MKAFQFLSIIILFGIMSCSTTDQTKERQTRLINTALTDGNYLWALYSPQPGTDCDLQLSFAQNNKILMRYRDVVREGYYEIDSVLTNYITINIFNKTGWDNACDINPQYLSLYDHDTQFSYQILDDRLYFQKNEKVIVFQQIEDNGTDN